MPELVRVALTENAVELAWPPRCPRCGADKRLTTSTSRVGRVKSLRPNLMGGWTMRSNVMYVSIPMCEKHAGANTLANKVLEKSPAMTGLRLLTYFGATLLAEIVVTLLRGNHAWERLWDLDAFLLFPAIALAGLPAIWWARRNTTVWPRRFDPDMDVLEIQFSDARYARHFKRANPSSTDEIHTAPPPWYMRSLTWKIAAAVVLVAWLRHLMH